jgi:hypothetical protein
LFEQVRKGIGNEKLKIGKWTRLVRIMEIKLRDNFGSMSEFISWNP